MKKITFGLFAVIALASCGGGNTEVTTTDSTTVVVDTTKVDSAKCCAQVADTVAVK